jgi:hypothetical protein
MLRRVFRIRVEWLLALAAIGCSNGTSKAPAGPGGSLGAVHVVVREADGAPPIACKLLLSVNGQPLSLGGEGMIGDWLAPHVLANGEAVYGDPCDLQLMLPPGTITIQASSGIEHEIASADVHPDPRVPAALELRIPRAIDSSGYACADFHVHSAPSFDSDVPLDQRLISAVAEGLDAIAPTDHDAVGDWDADLAKLNMADELTLVLGNEVTPDQWPTPQAIGHFGIFPVPQALDPSAYEVPYQTPGALLERLDSLFPDSVIQVNHPRWDAFIGYFVAGNFDPRDPTLDQRLGLSHLDAIELWNSHEFDAVGGPPIETLLQDYYALLDLGFHLVATGNTDTHELSRHPLGYPRNCIRVENDRHPGLTPGMVTDGLALGQVFVTSGPWLEVSLDGHGPGQVAPRPEAPVLEVGVDAPGWVPVDRVHIVVNGRTQMTLSTPRLPARLKVPLELPDAVSYIMVLAEGDAPLPSVAGRLVASPQRSFAFTNPLWVAAPAR